MEMLSIIRGILISSIQIGAQWQRYKKAERTNNYHMVSRKPDLHTLFHFYTAERTWFLTMYLNIRSTKINAFGEYNCINVRTADSETATSFYSYNTDILI